MTTDDHYEIIKKHRIKVEALFLSSVIERTKYNSLSEKEKIPLKIKLAKKTALEELAKGVDLNQTLKELVEGENFCGAEGIRQALLEFKKPV